MNASILEARRRAGLSQVELASLAGVTRQLVSAVESGRHAPSVTAALGLAGALGRSVEELFGGPNDMPSPVLGTVLRPGTPVRIARVGEGSVYAPLIDQDDPWDTADAIVSADGVERFPGAERDGFVVVGCDPALHLAAGLLDRAGGVRLVAVQASTGSALAALETGLCHAAVVHGPAGALPDAPASSRRLRFCRWRVGIASAGALDEDAVASGAVAIVQREPGAAGQQALERFVGARAGRLSDGLRARGHLDAVRHTTLTGVPALTFEPAANAARLRFLPIETHVVELWFAAAYVDHPGAIALGGLLASAGFQGRLEAMGGYDLDGCGSVRSSV